MHLHDTKSLYSKVIEVNHGLLKQVAVAGNGRGEYVIIEGHPRAHKVIFELLKFDIVWRVVCDTGYFMITVSEPRRWPEITGEVLQMIAKHVPEKTTKD